MSRQDEQIVNAAQADVMWKCEEQTEDLSSEALANIRAWLTWDPIVPSRLYGSWDAKVIAIYGWDGRGDGLSMGSDTADLSLLDSCFSSDTYLSIEVVDTKTLPRDGSFSTGDLIMYTIQAYNKTVLDSRFQALAQAHGRCIRDQGYSTDGSDVEGVQTDATWSDEQVLQAMVVEATCADQMNFTQQVADINAAYEQQFIDLHQAELVTIKSIADVRVSDAKAILHNDGIV